MFKIVRHAATDLSTHQLPGNRREAFVDVIRLRWSLLLRLGLIFFCFCLPLSAVSFLNTAGIQTVYAQMEAGELEEAAALAQIASLQVSFALWMIPCFGIIAAGLAPITLTFIKLSWQKGILLGADFQKALRQDSPGTGLVGLLMGGLNFLAVYIRTFFTANTGGTLAFAGFVPQFLFYIAVLPVFALFVPLNAIYTDPIGQKLKNAFFLYTRSLPVILLFCLAAYGLLCPALFGNAITNAIVQLIYCCLVFPFLHLAWILYCNALFDKHINRHHYPDLVNRGLWNVKE